MQAIILAGGLGKRLRPLTDYLPKPLVPINNIPIIEWQIKYLNKYGISDITVCSGYKSEQIENFVKAKGTLGNVRFSVEKEPLGTAGAIKKVEKSIHQPFIVINGDVITNIDLGELTKSENAIAAIELRTKFGIMEIFGNNVTKFFEKKEVNDLWMNAGIYYFNADIFKDLPTKGDIEKTTFPKYAEEGKLHTVKFRNIKWFSIDSFKDIEECSHEIQMIRY